MRAFVLALALLAATAREALATWPTDVATDIVVATGPLTQYGQVGCSDGAGGMILAWQDRRNGSAPDVYAQRIDADGNVRWTANGVPVCTRAGNDLMIEIVSDGAGGAIVGWQNEGSARRVFAQRLDADGNALWDANGRRVGTLEAQQDLPHVVSDLAGGALVFWVDGRGAVATNRPIYGQRLAPDGTRLWGDAGDSLTVRGSKSNFAACSDGLGGAWLAWSDITRRPAAQRVLSNSSTGPQVELVPAAFSNQVYLLQVAPVGGGDAIVTLDYSVTHTLWAQRVSAGGTLPWGVDPVLVCDSPTDQLDAKLVPDDAGGAIVAWSVQQPGGPEGRAQRVRYDGVPLWAPNGIVVWSAPLTVFRFGIAADGVGGCLFSRGDIDGHQRVHRVSAVGEPMWDPAGVQISTRGQNSTDPFVLATPEGGALLAWTGTLQDIDLFAKRVYANGSISTVDAPVPAAAGGVTLALTGAHPVRGAARFAYALATPGEARVSVFDVQGRERLRRTLGRRDAGRHTFTLAAADLPAGVAFVRVSTSTGAATRRIVRIE